MKKIMVISLIIFVLGFFFISCHQREEKTSSPSPALSFTPMSINLSYAGWGSLDLHKSLNDGFAVYGCSTVRLKDVKIASVNYEGEPDLEFFGAVGGMGEIDIEGDSYISGDLVYPPGGTFTVSDETEIKGFKYAWGVSECPWWSYENASRWDLKSNYPEVLTVSSKVTLEAGGYRFKLLDVESGGELYGRGVSIVAERVIVDGGKINIGREILIANKIEINSGELIGRFFADFFSGNDVWVKGKIVGGYVSIDGGDVYYDSDLVCRDNECRVVYSLEVTNGELKREFTYFSTRYLYMFTFMRVVKSDIDFYPPFSAMMLPIEVDREYEPDEDGLQRLLNLVTIMRKLGYCLVGIDDQRFTYTLWVPIKGYHPPNIFYLERLLTELADEGVDKGVFYPFSLAAAGNGIFSYETTGGVIVNNYIRYLESEYILINKSKFTKDKWMEYARWVTANCNYGWMITSWVLPIIDGYLKTTDEVYARSLYEDLSYMMKNDGFVGFWGGSWEEPVYYFSPFDDEDEIWISFEAWGNTVVGGYLTWKDVNMKSYYTDFVSYLPLVAKLLDPQKASGEVFLLGRFPPPLQLMHDGLP